MRVTYLSAAAIPSRAANSIQVMKMCEAMSLEGHDVTLLAPKGWGWGEHITLTESVWSYYGVQPVFAIQWLPAPGPRPSYPYGANAAAYVRRQSPDSLVYARHLPGALGTALLGRRLVFEAHELPSASSRAAAVTFTQLTRRKSLQRVVVISHALRDAILRRWPRLRPDRVVVAPDGVDLDAFPGDLTPQAARSKLGLTEWEGRVVAGYAGQLYSGRGMDLILEAARRLPDISFLVVGGEPQDVQRVQSLLAERKIENVTLTGFVRHADVPLYISACDLLLMPYQRRVEVAGGGRDTTRWMSPLKLFEYLAAGRLIVASDLPVLREVLDDDTAVLLDPADIDGWCIAVASAAREPDWAARRASAARAAAAQYSWRARTSTCLPT